MQQSIQTEMTIDEVEEILLKFKKEEQKVDQLLRKW